MALAAPLIVSEFCEGNATRLHYGYRKPLRRIGAAREPLECIRLRRVDVEG
jgi:hypothetical protein